MTAVAERIAPGVHDGMPEADYHAATWALSASGAKALLSTPAKFAYEQQHPRQPTDAMQLGTAAHRMVLGVGRPIHVIEAKDWRTKAAQEERDEYEASGHIVMLPPRYEVIAAMAEAIKTHPTASVLLTEVGRSEVSLFWTGRDGLALRCRFDRLPDPHPGRRMIVTDYKTCSDASEDAITRQSSNLKYHLSAWWYCDGIRSLGIHPDPQFVHVYQETDPPYLVNVIQLDAAAMDHGAALASIARERYRDCMAAGVWPGYGDDVKLISLPRWAKSPEEYL